MHEKNKVSYIAIDDMAGELGLLREDLLVILKPLSPPVRHDRLGRACIPKTFIEMASSSDKYLAARARAVATEKLARIHCQEDHEFYRRHRGALLAQYKPWIADLEAIHKKYLAAANQAGGESSAMASYLLLSRAISTLRALHTCLEHGHWYGASLFRDIDEALDLAHYFSITSDTEEGQRACLRWFRENTSPKHEHCRRAIAEFQASLLKTEQGEHLDLLRELYGKKSKWTHPTFSAIREITEFVPTASLQVEAIDYGPCSYEFKLCELTDFFRSSIWSTFQTLWLCLGQGLKLSSEDNQFLGQYDHMFQKFEPDSLLRI